MASKISKVFVL